ncbi:MAG TPA: NAD-dependent epimerase/dehydratase family protein [Vicinamibacteria bacterium]
MKVLLTGGTGFLGKSVARALDAAGHELRVLARPTSDLRGLPAGAAVVQGDVTDAASYRRAAEGCRGVVHLAALVKMWVPERERFDEVNVGGLRHALAAAAENGARLVYTSSFIAVGPSGPEPAEETRVHPGRGFRNDYERTKARADAVAREAAAGGADVVMLYPGVVYGPGELTDGNLVVRMLSDHGRGKLAGIVGPGDRRWSYAYVDDVARAHAAALERGERGQRYFLGGADATLVELFAAWQEVAGVAAPTRHIPYAAARALGWLLWLWAEVTGHPPLLTHQVVDVFREHWAIGTAKAERELGYEPRPLRDGLQATWRWLREQDVA